MSANEEIIINAILAGTREYLAHSQTVVGANEEMAASTETLGRSMERTTKRSYVMNQAIFTVRRLMYGVTLATIASGVAAVKWGFDFNSAMQSATVALAPLQSATFDVRKELDYLFNFTKYTPFQFKDITIAFRQMYGAMAPLGVTAEQVNGYIKAMVDALSFAGRTTPGALNRVAVALQHVAFQGHLTGQAVQQLARDGLPIYAALSHQLGLTADQMHKVGKLNIPVDVALKALHDYIESTPGFQNAAYRQATMTFHGLFTTFKDNLSQIMGYIEKGFFQHMQDRLREMNAWFDRISKVAHDSGGDVQAIMLAIGGPGAVLMWNRISDATHEFWLLWLNVTKAIMNSQVFWASVYGVLLLISAVLHAINPLIKVFGGTLVDLLIPALITWWTVTKVAAFWQGVLTLEEVLATAATKDLSFWQFIAAVATGRYMIAARLAAAMTWLYVAAQSALLFATEEVTVAFLAAGIAMLANPIGLIIAAIVLLTAGLVILYFKWQAFHDQVNRTWNWIVDHKLEVAAAITTAFWPLITVYELLKHISDIWHGLGRAFNWVTGGGTHSTAPIQPALRGSHPPHIAHQAAGGITTGAGLSWVGERGPELLSLPVGAQVTPLDKSPFNLQESWMGGGGRPPMVHTTVKLGRKVLLDQVAEGQAEAGARA